MTSHCDVEQVPSNDTAASPGEMTSHCDVEQVPSNDKAASPGEMTSGEEFFPGGRGSGEDVAPSRGVDSARCSQA